MAYRPVITTQSDLERVWRHLMSPLGFGGHSLWLMLLEPDGAAVPQLTEIEECPEVPDPEMVEQLGVLLGDLLGADGVVPGGRVAFLRSRPGRGGVDDDDRAFAASLYAAAAMTAAACEVVHLATDVDVLPLPLDALPLPATA